MGENAQKRIVRKLDLELFLSDLGVQTNPSASLEQYTTSSSVAATMLYIAAYSNNNIKSKSVLDLGCGTGRLGLGAAFLGAENVIGIDIDKTAIKIAQKNAQKVGLSESIQLINGDISVIIGEFDTVLQNPPFGVQTREADRAFLIKALEVGNWVYSFHNHPETDSQLIKRLKANDGFLRVEPSPFLERFIGKHGGTVEAVYAIPMSIPRMFEFHTKSKHDFIVDLYVIKNSSG